MPPEKDSFTALERKRLREIDARISRLELKLAAARWERANLVDAMGEARFARILGIPKEEVTARSWPPVATTASRRTEETTGAVEPRTFPLPGGSLRGSRHYLRRSIARCRLSTRPNATRFTRSRARGWVPAAGSLSGRVQRLPPALIVQHEIGTHGGFLRPPVRLEVDDLGQLLVVVHARIVPRLARAG